MAGAVVSTDVKVKAPDAPRARPPNRQQGRADARGGTSPALRRWLATPNRSVASLAIRNCGVTVAMLFGLTATAACESSEAKQCRAQYLATHALLDSVDVDDFKSVEQGLETVKSTTTACKAAGLTDELEQLAKVEAKLQSNFDYLRTHGTPKKLSAEALAQLVEEGDPNCPKGQAYKPKASEQQIKCTGPKLVDMNWQQARAFFERRGFKFSESGSSLKAEYGSESYTFEYDKPNDDKPARCVRVFAAPGISWQESVARLTGSPPHRLKEGQPVATSRGKLPLAHTPDTTQAIYRIGHCE